LVSSFSEFEGEVAKGLEMIGLIDAESSFSGVLDVEGCEESMNLRKFKSMTYWSLSSLELFKVISISSVNLAGKAWKSTRICCSLLRVRKSPSLRSRT